MTSEPLTMTATPTETADSSERGLLIAVLIMVVLGVAAMLVLV